MKKIFFLGMAGLLLAACNPGQPVSPAAETPTTETATPTPAPTVSSMAPKLIVMAAQNKSGQSGTVTLSEVDGKLKVVISLAGKNATPEPAHIHLGKCPNPGAVKYPLANVVNGQSETLLDITLSDFLSVGDLAVNVHKSAQAMGTYMACGDIK